jgi:long-chain acyl-CoA synthetase
MSQPKSAPYNVPAIGYSKIRGETLPMRSQSAKHGLKLVDDGVQTVFDILTYSAEKFTTANCYGYREIVETHEEIRKIKTKVNGVEEEVDKKWTYFQLSEYKYVSFEEHKRNATECGAGLRKLGMGVGDRLHMFAVTSRYWITMAHGMIAQFCDLRRSNGLVAATTQSIPIVTAYETLGRDGLQHSLIQTKAKAIFVDSALLPKLANVLKHTTDIKHIIYSNEKDIKPEEIENLRKEYLYLTIHSLDQLQQLGKEFHVDPVPPEPNDLCCIMYTSGSTGPPKGVLLKHRNIIAAST